MKLRNKKTGEIKNVNHNHVLIHFNDGETRCINSIGELNEEWEDYEEPKELYRLTSYGEVVRFSSDGISNTHKRECVNIGNYFKTREEAEKAMEKLKAWRRLKDKGFRITLQGCNGNAWLQANWDILQGDYSDVLFLFGGEE